jgi:tetratricopeptide (TPR) repeat protein
MKKIAVASLSLACLTIATIVWSSRTAAVTVHAGEPNQPVYTSGGELVLPASYRDWVFLTSGYGMNYSNGGGDNPMFTNVYVSPEAYQRFKANAKWPDKSMFVVEIYSATTHGSINKAGHYQDAFMGLDVEVKDSSRPNEWSYYNFEPNATSAAVIGNGGCNKCHTDNAAVEHTFVQFYPTLLDFSLEKGVVKPTVNIPLNATRFLKLIDSAGWDKAEQAYREDRKKNPESEMLSEHTLNMVGYMFLEQKKTAQAVSLFKLITQSYPDSANAYDSLADAYVAAGQSQEALAASQKELALVQSDPHLSPELKKRVTERAQNRMAELQAKPHHE